MAEVHNLLKIIQLTHRMSDLLIKKLYDTENTSLRIILMFLRLSVYYWKSCKFRIALENSLIVITEVLNKHM